MSKVIEVTGCRNCPYLQIKNVYDGNDKCFKNVTCNKVHLTFLKKVDLKMEMLDTVQDFCELEDLEIFLEQNNNKND